METKIFEIDQSHSTIGFSVKYMMFSKVRGQFDEYEATVEMLDEDFRNAKLKLIADAHSINTHDEERDKHLRGADFFDAEENNEIVFESTRINEKEDNKYEISGNLMMNGITRPVTLDAEYSGLMKDPSGNKRISLVISGKIDRYDWEMKYNSPLETGGVLVGKEVAFEIETQFI